MDSATDLLKFIVNSSASRHVCNNKHLFINILTYSGLTSHITLGNGCTRASIIDIGTIEFIISAGKTVRLHSVLYIPTLNIRLFSVEQHTHYDISCYKHSENNVCLLAFPPFTIPVSNKKVFQLVSASG